MLSDSERKTALTDLAESSAALMETVHQFSEAEFTRCPGEGCWSAAQNLEHIVFVEGRVLGRLRSALETPADPTRQSAISGREEEMIADVRARRGRIEAPAILHPSGKVSREELIRAFHEARAGSTAFATETKEDLRAHFATHPVFGDLDCFQWLMLIPAHCERHRRQMAEIIGKA